MHSPPTNADGDAAYLDPFCSSSCLFDSIAPNCNAQAIFATQAAYKLARNSQLL